MLTTTLRKLREHGACSERYAHLVAALGEGWGDDATIPLLRVIDLNGTEDAIWAFRACEPEAERDKIARLFACDCAESVLPIFERERPDDNRPREAIRIARLFAYGEATGEQRAAGGGAARAGARDAAGDAERNNQSSMLRKLLGGAE